MKMDIEARKRGRPRLFEGRDEDKVVRALDKGLVVLRVISESDGLSLSEIAETSEVSAPTAYRSLITMQMHGLVAFDDHTQLWRIDVEAFRVGSAFLSNSAVSEQARPVMQRLMESTGETSNLGILSDREVVFLSQAETHEPIRAFFRPGTRSPVHTSGIGKALLAFRPREEAQRLAEQLDMKPFTDNTICSADDLMKAVDEMVAQGFAVDDEERTLGMRCVAAPIFNSFGEAVAAISTSGPSVRVTKDRVLALGKQVRAAADEISRNIAGRIVDFS
ncbi:HTH-type transcriptional repressor AllR [Ahrensia sp. R2A130]|nr:HTH-type transcriptional repressor AllR [Ahrensia sp. R2A130]